MALSAMPPPKDAPISNRTLGLFQGESPGDRSFSGWEPKRLFHQLPGGDFEECAFAEGFDSRADGRSLVAADLDGDGDLDLVLLNRNEPALQLFRNDGPVGASVELEVRAKRGDPEAPGAQVRVRTAAGDRLFPVLLARGYESWVDPAVHAGLGAARGANVSVRWPGAGGGWEDFGQVAAGGRYLLRQGSGKPTLARAFRPPPPSPAPLPAPSLGALLPGSQGPLVVPLVATWCKPCWAEVPALNAVAGRKAVPLRGLSYAPSPEGSGVARKMGLSFPVEPAGPAREALLAQWGVSGLPATLVFDEGGHLARVLQGGDRLAEALRELSPSPRP